MTVLPCILMLLYADSCFCMGPWVLRCPYMPEQKDMHRVWCKRTSADCCSGIVFNNTTSQLENGAVMVHEDSGTFSLKVLRLSQGEGVYWCGLLNLKSDIIKLAEMEMQRVLVGTIPPSPRMTNFTASTFAPTLTNLLNDVWWILRWILMAVLLTITPTMHLCFRIKKKRQS